MKTPDDIQQEIDDFHAHLAALHKLHQQNLAMRYHARMQQTAPLAQRGVEHTRLPIASMRRFVSRQLVRLAHWIEPTHIASNHEEPEEADAIEGVYRVL